MGWAIQSALSPTPSHAVSRCMFYEDYILCFAYCISERGNQRTKTPKGTVPARRAYHHQLWDILGWLANPSPKIPWYTRLQTAWFRPIPPTHNREPYDTTTILSNIMSL